MTHPETRKAAVFSPRKCERLVVLNLPIASVSTKEALAPQTQATVGGPLFSSVEEVLVHRPNHMETISPDRRLRNVATRDGVIVL